MALFIGGGAYLAMSEKTGGVFDVHSLVVQNINCGVTPAVKAIYLKTNQM